MTTAAQMFARYATSFALDDAPVRVVDKAKSCIADTVGVALAGARTPWAEAAVAAALAEGRRDGGSHVLGTRASTSPALAAMANGTSGHSLDFDDDNAQVHAGAAVVPTALAVAEATGATGRDLVRAVVLGYEAGVRVGWAFDPDALYARGFHPTGVANAFGCTVTAGALFGLTEQQLVHALGVAGSMAGGLLEFYTDGAMTKRLHGGHPAYCGVMAARLAAEGFTGPSSVFDGPYGVLRAYSDRGDPEPVIRGLGSDFAILATAQKHYPMNFATHGAVDLVRRTMHRDGLTPADVARVRVSVRPFVAEAIGGVSKYRPATVLAAQMSMPFAVAVTMLEETVTLEHLTERWIRDETVLAAAQKVETVADPELDTVEGVAQGSVLPTRITVETAAGAACVDELVYQRGDPRNPLSAGDIENKFLDCAGRVLDPERARRAYDDLLRIDEWTDATTFMQSVRT